MTLRRSIHFSVFFATFAFLCAFILPASARAACVPAGCSGQVCVTEEQAANTVTTCEFRPEYTCYTAEGCVESADGACSWDKSVENCLENFNDIPVVPELPVTGVPEDEICVITGCNNDICVSEDVAIRSRFACDGINEDIQACYKDNGLCAVQENGGCGWSKTNDLKACLDPFVNPDVPPVPEEPEVVNLLDGVEESPCTIAPVCGRDICITELELSLTSFLCDNPFTGASEQIVNENACYKEFSACEKTTNGTCRWNKNEELVDCLDEANPAKPVEETPEIVDLYEGIEDSPCTVISPCGSDICTTELETTLIAYDCMEPNAESDKTNASVNSCYNTLSSCDKQENGRCEWNKTPELSDCIVSVRGNGEIIPDEPAPDCVITGCNDSVCIRSDLMGDLNIASDACVALPEYGCYNYFGSCGMNPDGNCEWKATDELNTCLKDPAAALKEREKQTLTDADRTQTGRKCKCKRRSSSKDE